MPAFILDTHTLLWHEDDPQLSQAAKETIKIPENTLVVSIVSFWEIVIKQGTGKLKLDYTINDLAAACLKNNIEILSVRLYNLSQLSLLPLIHRDPFDRMIVATAYGDKLTLILLCHILI